MRYKLPSKAHLYYEKIKQWAIDFANKSFVAKCIITFLIWLVALIPVWITWLVWWLVAPVGFWQGFAVVVLCMVVLGAPQFWLLMGGVFLTISVVLMD
jgi:hypothetical protein